MSHAIVLVAVDGIDNDASIDTIHGAVHRQMEPFDENGEWFKDGSRWDWWVIGGRYDKRLFGVDWIRRRQVSPDAWADFRRRMLIEEYHRAHEEAATHDDQTPEQQASWLQFAYGIEPGHTLEQYLDVHAYLLHFAFPVFLRDHTWSENGRMGWCGTETATECERVGGAEPKRCVFQLPEYQAQTVSYQEDRDAWYRRYFDRFIRRLDPSTLLVVVDYHV